MDIAELLGQQVPPTPQSAAEPAGEPPAVEETVEEPVEPSEVVKDVTPSGILVEYQAKPKRRYRVNGVEVPSVTTVLGVLDKPALLWWGMKVGVEGVLELYRRGTVQGRLAEGSDFDFPLYVDIFDEDGRVVDHRLATMPDVVDALTRHKLTVNHVRDAAGERGVNVHDALEQWAKTGLMPDPDKFPETERGYVQGLVAFLEAAKPEPIGMEVMVGSAEHGFAGRYDMRWRIPVDVELVIRQMPVRQRRDVVPAGVHLSDLKTSAGVFPNTHFRQLEAYEAAGIEGGYEPTDARYVLHVDAQGRYEYVRSTADFEDFLAVLEVWQSNQRLKGKA